MNDSRSWEQVMASTPLHRRMPRFTMLSLVLSALTACASAPPPRHQPPPEPVTRSPGSGDTASRPNHGLAIARTMLGAPYHYGGASPRGFDCSGLVYYSYRKAGIKVPRTTREQYRQSRHVDLDHLRPGDLVFFRISRAKPSHVGIYVGGGRFIHAPSRGKRVSYASLDDPYWKVRVIGAGRFR